MAYDFFERFGGIESTNIRIRTAGDLHYVLVQFKDAKVADDLIKQGQIMMNNIEFEIKPLYEIRKPNDKSSINNSITEQMETSTLSEMNIDSLTLTQNSPNNIMNALFDDCLRLIFEKIYHPADFNSIANVCLRFKRIAKEIFPSKIRQRTISLDKLIFGHEISLLQIETFLRDFGWSVSSVYLSEYHLKNISNESNTLLRMMAKYCKNLEHLDLHLTGVETQTLIDIHPLLSKLKYLRIYLSHKLNFGPFTEFISACTQLETLKLTGWNINEYTLPAITFQKLINFEMTVPDFSIDAFLKLNPQIEELDTTYSLNVCRLAANKMPNIRKFILDNNNNNLFNELDSIHLRHIKHLEVHMSAELSASITNIIFPMKNIKELRLSVNNNIFDESLLIGLTRNLYNLKKLYIFLESTEQKITTNLFKKMLQNANQLSELQIYWANESFRHFDESDYYEILEIVKSRANHLKLIIEIVCQTTLFDPKVESFSGHKTKLIRFDMDPKWLSVSVTYKFDEWKY